MSASNLLQYGVFLAVVTVLVKPLGGYMARVFSGGRTFLDPLLCPLERRLYRMTGVDPDDEMDWKRYATAFVLFSLTGTLLLYALLRLQRFLPWFFPGSQTAPVTPDLAMNTAISFATTTTWQAYAGESTMSYTSQIAGLMVQNFLAGASGLAVGVAFIRGLAREQTSRIGNFWVDMTRSLLWVLLPISLLGSLVLVWQGVPMNWHEYTQAKMLDGGQQIIAQGPVAGFEIIKNLGTNGGGFFNANGAHPYENPTPLANFFELLAIAVLPAAFTNTFGRMIGRPRQGWLLYCVMMVLLIPGLVLCGWAEQRGNPRLKRIPGLAATMAHKQPGGNMEGKEVRFGIGGSALTAVVTSNGATGSTNSQHDSYVPLGGAIPLVNMLLGEIVFGGLGTGLYSIVMIALVGLILGGLMVGRMPEYLGKKIGPCETKYVTLYVLAGPLAILPLTAVALMTKAGLAGLATNTGEHGFTEILFAFASCFANNGQSFAGLNANTVFYNFTTAAVMMAGRFALAIPVLALAGLLASQIRRQEAINAVPTDGVLFGGLLVATALIVGGLSFFPALSLGPILEHLILK
ncbi:MAG TPA: potassium-transporting ATPase subunit KdpA [Candidatus Sulfotelmatobacter sp.]|nr:potassium-transporting ATPase subunit KdpA [Candidatus Sulfotelmatobacter sp.]